MGFFRRFAGLSPSLFLVCATALPAAAQMHRDFLRIGQRDINHGDLDSPNLFSPDEELEQGLEIDALLLQQVELSDQPEVLSYLESLAESIRRRSDFNGELRIRLVRNQSHIASATLAGYIYLDEEVFRRAANESELAGVLAHEIGHLAARHGAENITRLHMLRAGAGRITNTLLPSMSLPESSSPGRLSDYWKHVRHENENEADELATQYLWNAGFDPKGLLNFLRHDEERSTPTIPKKQDSHPTSAKRLEKIHSMVVMLPPLPAARMDSSGFVAARDRLHQ